MTMQRRISTSMTDCGPPPTQPPDRASSGGGDRLGALSAPATGSSSSTSTSPAAVAAATTALGILTSGSSYGGNSANVHLHGLHSVHAAHAAAQNQHHHPDYPPTTSLSRNGSLGSVGFRSSLMGSSPQQQAGGPGPHGLWGHSAAGTPSAVPLLSPAELAEAADGSIHNSDSIQVLLAQMRQRVQAEQQQQQQAKSELHFQTKKRSRTMMMESNSNNTNTNTNNDSASISSLDNSQNKGSTSSSSSYLGRGGAAAAAELLRANSAPLGASSPGLTSLLAMQSGGSIASLNSALSGLGGNAGAGNAAAAAANNVSMAQLEQLVRKQQQRQGLQQFKQLKKNWYNQARLLNKTAVPFLIGTKYDYFINMKTEEQKEITVQARKFAKAMKAPLIYCSSSHSINVNKIFKIVLSKVFDLKCKVPEIHTAGDPLIEYKDVAGGSKK